MKNLFAAFVALVSFSFAFGQPTSVARVNGVSVRYNVTYNGNPSGSPMSMSCDSDIAAVVNVDGSGEQIFVDYSNGKYYNLTVLPSGDTITVVTPFTYGAGLEEVGKERILNSECTKYRTIINSNTIEIWATSDYAFKGTVQPASGVPDGLVLKVSRNGNRIIEATELTQLSGPKHSLLPPSWGRIVDMTEYRWLINNKDVADIEVFNNQTIGFDGSVGIDGSFAAANPDKIYTLGGGTVILRRVKLPENIDGRSIFMEVSQCANRDAYDRTGSIFIIPTDKDLSFLDALAAKDGLDKLPAIFPQLNDGKGYAGLVSTANYDVPLELMRFFTPFGVRGYGHIKVKGMQWDDSVTYKRDVTTFANALKGEVWVGAYIGNWAADGHKLSLRFRYHPNEKSAANDVVMPLFNTVNLLEQAGQSYPVFFDKQSLTVRFYLDRELKNPQLIYTSTGHGGWGGGDEFNQKMNTIKFDKMVVDYIPWRDDCASYRARNPASGNYANGLSSSDLSRSNWCPGTVSNPFYINVGGAEKTLRKGWHTVQISIPQGAPEGNSISYWCVSGILVGQTL